VGRGVSRGQRGELENAYWTFFCNFSKNIPSRMPSTGTLGRVALVRTDVSEEYITSIIRVTRIGVLWLLVTANAVPTSLIHFTPMMEAIRFFETSVITRATRRKIQEYELFLVTAVKTSNLTWN
jgi:hypothetical protein